MFLSSLDRRVISDPSVDLVSLILWVVRLCLILSEIVCVPGHSVRSGWPGCLWYPLIIRVVLIDFIESDSIVSGFSEAPSCLWSLLVSGFTEPLWGCLCPRLLGEVWVTQLLLVVTDYSDRTQWLSLLFTCFNLLLLFVFADLLSRQEFRRMQFTFSSIRSDLYLFCCIYRIKRARIISVIKLFRPSCFIVTIFTTTRFLCLNQLFLCRLKHNIDSQAQNHINQTQK